MGALVPGDDHGDDYHGQEEGQGDHEDNDKMVVMMIITRSSSLPTVEAGRGSQGMWDAWKKVQC